MDLKFRRNLPLLLLFVAILTFLVLGLGDKPIIAYSVASDGGQVDGTELTEDDISGDTLSLSESENAGIVASEGASLESLQSDSVLGAETNATQDQTIAVDSEGEEGSNLAPDEG